MDYFLSEPPNPNYTFDKLLDLLHLSVNRDERLRDGSMINVVFFDAGPVFFDEPEGINSASPGPSPGELEPDPRIFPSLLGAGAAAALAHRIHERDYLLRGPAAAEAEALLPLPLPLPLQSGPAALPPHQTTVMIEFDGPEGKVEVDAQTLLNQLYERGEPGDLILAQRILSHLSEQPLPHVYRP